MPAGRGDARNFGNNSMPPPDYQRNTVGMEDLRRLNNRNRPQASQGPATFGPTSMFAGRTASGRNASGRPGGNLSRGADDSPSSSGRGTPARKDAKDEKEPSSANAFR